MEAMESVGAARRSRSVRRSAALVAIVAVAVLALPGCGPRPNHPFPQHVSYAAGTARPNNFTQTAQDNHVKAYYNDWKSKYVVDAGGSSTTKQYRIAFGDRGTPQFAQTVSEGQGYGMIIVAHMAGYDSNAKTIFDGLYRFFRAHPSDIDGRLMGFLTPPPGDSNDSAFDGDADIAYGLLLADKQWGSDGAIDYKAAATTLLGGVLGSTVGPQSRLPELGDWVDANGATYNQWSPRTSDFMPSHFRAFQRSTTGTAASTWGTVVTRSQEAITDLQTRFSPTTGLLPDFTQGTATALSLRPAGPDYLEDAHDGHFDYNACRDPWRIATDALVNGNATSKAQAQRISLWAERAAGGVAANVKAGYKLDGTAYVDYFSIVFTAPLAVAAMTSTTQQPWLNRLYASIYNVHEGYYEDSVTLLSLLVLTGNWWDPTTI